MRNFLAICASSVAIIGFQLAVIANFSYSHWHHFSYLAISIAMLGFGASGITLALWRSFWISKGNRFIPGLLAVQGASVCFAAFMVSKGFLAFDSILLFSYPSHAIRFFIACLLFTIPFITGGTIIGLILISTPGNIGRLYAANLAASALGAGIYVGLAGVLLPIHHAMFYGMFLLLASLLMVRSWFGSILTCITLILVVLAFLSVGGLPGASQFKTISRVLRIPDAHLTVTQPTLPGIAQKVSGESIRVVAGVSLNYCGAVPSADMWLLNGNAYFTCTNSSADTAIFRHNLFAFPYLLLKPDTLVFLQPGSTFYIEQSLHWGSGHSLIVEPIGPVIKELTDFYGQISGIVCVKQYPRRFLDSSPKPADAIVYPTIGSMGGIQGLTSASEDYLFTVQSFQKALKLVKPQGAVVLSAYLDNPPRNALKLFNTALSAAKNDGLNPHKHIVAIRSWNILLVIIARFELDPMLTMAKDFCSRYSFDMVYPVWTEEFNAMPDSTFTHALNALDSEAANSFAHDYPFNLKVPTDNQPFFNQFVRVAYTKQYLEWLGGQQLPFLEMGYYLVWFSFSACSLFAMLIIVVPVLIRRSWRGSAFALTTYFASIGAGFMLLEVVYIQRAILLLGNPVTASALVITWMLLFSGLGSLLSHRFGDKLWFAAGPPVAALLIAAAELFFLLAHHKVGILWFLVPVAFISLVLGMFFPKGLAFVNRHYPSGAPMVWSVNGFFSVVAAPLASILAIEFGFVAVGMVSAMLYLACVGIALFNRRLLI